ncbi:MAG TPA: pyridoxal phosphate-dependent aminotransferase family protein [Chloroflexota bacterium]|nr:pyridoxal phosphate-dependent aminotransferase family protein [Chloroflexota bacterium]
MDLFDKCGRLTKPREAQLGGFYPYFVPIESPSGPEVIIGGKPMIMLGSNNYLGLTQHPTVIEAARAAIDRYGTGCTGSRLLNGTLDLHQELERRLARFVGKESALVFTTGFQVNLGVISALVGRNDVLILDRADHASIVDGARLSFGKTVRFPHNDMGQLERILQAHAGSSGCLIVVDGVFSMEGDLANLPEIVRLAQRYGARVMVDDAHGVGVMGPDGRGTAHHFGVEEQVDLIMGTFSKSFASTGGFVAGSEEVIYYIKHTARAFLFSASIPPASAAAALAALDVIESEPERVDKLWANARRMKHELDALGFDTGASTTPIIPIVVGEEYRLAFLWRKVFDSGVFVNAAVAPAVEPDHALLRTSYMATHEPRHLDRALAVFEQAGKEFGLIS